MSEHATPVPSVLLTPDAFQRAQDVGIQNILYSPEGMRDILAVTQSEDVEHLPPVVTIVREYRGGRDLAAWDQTFAKAPDDFLYIPAQGLPVEDRPMRTISAGSLRRQGGAIVDLTIKEWGDSDKLPEELAYQLAYQIEELKVLNKGPGVGQGLAYAVDALSTLGKWGLGVRGVTSARYQRQTDARSTRPYIVSYHPDKFIPNKIY